MRNMTGLNPYNQMSHLAKINGGPQNFINNVFGSGFASGYSSGYAAGNKAGLLKGGIAVGGVVFIGFGIYKGVKALSNWISDKQEDMIDEEFKEWTVQ